MITTKKHYIDHNQNHIPGQDLCKKGHIQIDEYNSKAKGHILYVGHDHWNKTKGHI